MAEHVHDIIWYLEMFLLTAYIYMYAVYIIFSVILAGIIHAFISFNIFGTSILKKTEMRASYKWNKTK